MLPSILALPADTASAASGNAAVITYAAVAGKRHAIGGIAWSYDADPTAGNLKVEDGSGNTIFTMDITKGGAGFIPFTRAKLGSVNTAMVVTLADGSVNGKVNVTDHWTQ